ncbi:SagB/ThcOx family dehydrogenase [bacterium]|nr:SagB/ThcOx family dehydrogenase [bacterium]MBU1993726.1 SagB/ThcOx family dehydrogenase [bacterium]
MNKKLQDIFMYHEETKHSHKRYAKSLGYMDWANQANPFRSYQGAAKKILPLAFSYPTPPYHLLFRDKIPTAPLLINSVSQFLQFSMGISAIKSNGVDTWALRCNASSGNLHPSEAYLILPPLEGIGNKTNISHYAPKDHSLEILASIDTDIWNTLPENSFFIALSSIVYREVWKYGERAFRYTQLDAGHAQRAIQISAKALGWKYKLLSNISDKEISKLLGLEQKIRFNENENEIPEMLLLITPEFFNGDIDYSKIINALPFTFDSVANSLAHNYQKWPLISKIEDATYASNTVLEELNYDAHTRDATMESKKVILTRRSAQMMNKHNSEISYEQFLVLLNSTDESFNGFVNAVNLVLFVHNVKNLRAGLYIYLRNEDYKNTLMLQMNTSFLWKKIDENLYVLAYGDYKIISKNISCNQDIASEGAFSMGMLSVFAKQLIEHGEHRYKELYWECGAIGQQLYLEATSLGLSATGIGCYLDDVFHELLGLHTNTFQSLYHFTIGRGLTDKRILTQQPYEERV